MGTLMEDLQARIHSALNTTGTYDEALQKLANLYGASQSETGSRLIPVAADFDSSITTATAAQNYLLQNPAKLPTLGFDFINNQTLDSRITFTRASTATYFNSAGVLTSAGNNEARFDYNPSTLAARGLLIEESRVNSIRNNTMVGAVAGVIGSGGVLPTNWSANIAASGVVREVVGTGTEFGINYVDLRFSGTPTTTGALSVQQEPSNSIAGANGQTWAYSVWVKLVAGSFANLNTPQIYIDEYSSAPSYLAGSVSNVGALTSTLTRVTATRTNTNASTAFVVAGYRFFVTAAGTPIDITLRIGLPQMELGAFATSVIPTTTTALTRSADVASVNTLSPWFNATEGTLFVEAFGAVGTATYLAANITDGTTEIAGIRNFNNTARFVAQGTASGSAGAISSSTTYKAAFAFASGDQAMSVNGAAVLTGTTAITGTPTLMRIGSNSAASSFITAPIRRIAYYPRRLSNAELQAITA